MILPIYTYNHPVLKVKTADVDEVSANVRAFIDNMVATMRYARGIGLAANQVGHSVSIAVIDVAEASEEDTKLALAPLVMINPVIQAVSDDEDEFEEGCLSLPDFRDVVLRPSGIQVRYFDVDMKEHIQEVDGFIARVIQHEIDHLNGIYFFERLSPIRKTLSQGKLKRIARGDIETEYPVFRSE